MAARREPPRGGFSAARDIEIALDADLFLRAALGSIAVLVVLGLLAANALVSQSGVPKLFISAFLLDAEANIPTFFAFSLLVFCTVLLGLIGARVVRAREKFRLHWALLTALFALLAFDEAASLHERLIEPVRAAVDATGWIYFAWVIPASGVVAVLALLYMTFLRNLPAPFRRLFVLSGALYVGGALGVEMPEGAYAEAHGHQTWGFQVLVAVEETLEMLGLTVFAYTLMRFLARSGSVSIGFRAS